MNITKQKITNLVKEELNRILAEDEQPGAAGIDMQEVFRVLMAAVQVLQDHHDTSKGLVPSLQSAGNENLAMEGGELRGKISNFMATVARTLNISEGRNNTLLREYEEEEEWAPGEYLEIEISGDGYNRHIIKTPLDDYENQKSSMYTDVKALVQILQVAPPYED